MKQIRRPPGKSNIILYSIIMIQINYRIVFIIFPILVNCTTIGFHEDKIRESMDFGKMQEIKVCTISEKGIEPEEIDELFSNWNLELSLYSLKVISTKHSTMERPGFTGSDILNFLYTLPLTENCDRILYLKGRIWGDLFYEFFTLGIFAEIGIKLEVQGAVETKTNTRGYIKAKYISSLQVIFTSPKSTLTHEGYHLLGCGHQLFMEECYKAIQKAKQLSDTQEPATDFFPSLTKDGARFATRKQVNDLFQTGD